MALDPTARESNMRLSIIRYFVDNIKGTEGIEVVFDRDLIAPDTRSKVLDRWVSINFGVSTKETLSELTLSIHCLQRKDKEGYKLAQLVDRVMTYLVADATTIDGGKRIPFYQNFPTRTSWNRVSSFLVMEIVTSQDLLASDGTKFKTITVFLKWPANV